MYICIGTHTRVHFQVHIYKHTQIHMYVHTHKRECIQYTRASQQIVDRIPPLMPNAPEWKQYSKAEYGPDRPQHPQVRIPIPGPIRCALEAAREVILRTDQHTSTRHNQSVGGEGGFTSHEIDKRQMTTTAPTHVVRLQHVVIRHIRT